MSLTAIIFAEIHLAPDCRSTSALPHVWPTKRT